MSELPQSPEPSNPELLVPECVTLHWPEQRIDDLIELAWDAGRDVGDCLIEAYQFWRQFDLRTKGIRKGSVALIKDVISDGIDDEPLGTEWPIDDLYFFKSLDYDSSNFRDQHVVMESKQRQVLQALLPSSDLTRSDYFYPGDDSSDEYLSGAMGRAIDLSLQRYSAEKRGWRFHITHLYSAKVPVFGRLNIPLEQYLREEWDEQAKIG